MEQITFKLDVFEGPLDLMLHLILKHKLNINDIEISSLLEQYLDYINIMKASDLEVTSDFLAMAARLVYIKTLSLLPKHEDESEQLKRELQGQLLEYSMCKLMAQKMREQYFGNLIFTREPTKQDIDKTYSFTHRSSALLEAYLSAVGKAKRKLPPPRTAFTGIVSRRLISVESRIVLLLERLYRDGKAKYNELFENGDRSEMIPTFLAVLELIKSKRITISDDNSLISFNSEYQQSDNELHITAEGGVMSDGDQQ